jgi:hypothetical protein
LVTVASDIPALSRTAAIPIFSFMSRLQSRGETLERRTTCPLRSVAPGRH